MAWSYEPQIRFHDIDLYSVKLPLRVGVSHSRSLLDPLPFVACRDDVCEIH
jgi:hypothetical protein